MANLLITSNLGVLEILSGFRNIAAVARNLALIYLLVFYGCCMNFLFCFYPSLFGFICHIVAVKARSDFIIFYFKT